jgi:hypothetical protein
MRSVLTQKLSCLRQYRDLRRRPARLIEWIRSMKIVEQMDRIDAFLAAHPANGGQDNG